MICYKALVEDLNSEIDKVNMEAVSVSIAADAVRADGKIIYADLFESQKEVKENQESGKWQRTC